MKGIQIFSFVLGLLTVSTAGFGKPDPSHRAPVEVERVILLGIDGLHVDAISRFDLPNLGALVERGVLYRESHLPLADHPGRSEAYPWTCSLPNPVLHSGTVFIGRQNIQDHLIQHALKDFQTGFIANDKAYDAVAHAFTRYQAFRTPEEQGQDDLVLDLAKKWLQEEKLTFLRLHLQATGAGGFLDREAGRSIWAEDSEYQRRLRKADRHVGAFIDWLNDQGWLDSTVLMISSDHGQSSAGAHPAFEEGGERTALIILGAGVKQSIVFPYAEHRDWAPTIAWLLGTEPPQYADGRVLREAFVGQKEQLPGDRWMARLNRSLMDYHALQLAGRVPPPEETAFHGIREIGEWHQSLEGEPELRRIVLENERFLAPLQFQFPH